jgi:hypothetical protein
MPPTIVQALAAVRIATAVLYCTNVGADEVEPAEVIVTPAPAAKVNNPAPEFRKVIVVPTAAAVRVESGAIVTVLVPAAVVRTSTRYRSALATV